MSSYKKYIMMGVSIVLLPLAKRILQKLISKYTKEPQDDSAVEENGEFTRASRLSEGEPDNVWNRE